MQQLLYHIWSLRVYKVTDNTSMFQTVKSMYFQCIIQKRKYASEAFKFEKEDSVFSAAGMH